MRITEHIYIIGGASYGLSHRFDCNVYLIDLKDELVMIDAGAGIDSEVIIENIQRDGIDPKRLSKIFLTHSHADHSGGAYSFRKKFNCDVYISDEEADFVIKGGEKEIALDIAKMSGLYSHDYKWVNCEVDKRLKDGDVISICVKKIKVIGVPGHSKGSICFLLNLPEGKALFTGDSVFIDGKILVLNCDSSELSDYRRYINRLDNLNVELLFPGHGLFALSDGQKHLDKAIKSLKLLFLPENYI